ncbi:DMT family transporter [Actinotalea sp. Marseille-Q4924]|uniref:DMT family transporter n=1 Tax=Actinotalea sp. Marseille-Q4924 TaxID=2866571 RepID=UPI001CE3E7D4|nr:DMT family transporter [Actinotalea sp. Marseille-Q4924]
MTALVLALSASVLFGVGDFLGGTVSRRIPVTTVLVLSQLAAVLVLLPGALSGGIDLSSPGAVAWGVAAGVAGAVAIGSLFQALASGIMGVVAPISALGVLVPVGAGLLDGDRFGVALAIGLVVAVVGSVLATGPELRRDDASRASRRPIVLAFVAAVGFGSANLCIARGSAADVSTTVRVAAVTSLVVYAAATLVARRQPVVIARDLPWVLGVGVIGIAGMLLFATATRGGSLSVVAVLAALYPAVTAALGWRFLGERLRRVQIVGVASVFIGVAIVAGSS